MRCWLAPASATTSWSTRPRPPWAMRLLRSGLRRALGEDFLLVHLVRDPRSRRLVGDQKDRAAEHDSQPAALLCPRRARLVGRQSRLREFRPVSSEAISPAPLRGFRRRTARDLGANFPTRAAEREMASRDPGRHRQPPSALWQSDAGASPHACGREARPRLGDGDACLLSWPGVAAQRPPAGSATATSRAASSF